MLVTLLAYHVIMCHTPFVCVFPYSKYVIDLSQQKASVEKLVALRAVCCSALTQFILNDANAQLVVQVSSSICS